MDINEKSIASRDMLLPNSSNLSTTALLGYGYDVTGQYFHPKSVRARVINIDDLIENEVNRFQRIEEASSDTKIVAAENANEYCMKLTAKLDASLEKSVFSGSLSAKFNYDNKCSSKYTFGSFFLIMRKANVSLTVDSTDLQRYLLPDTFLRDIKSKSCQNIIRLYGTHVITNMTLGGRLEVLCRSIIDDSNKSMSIEAGVKASVKKILKVEADTTYSESALLKNSELTVSIETVGGDPGKSIISSFDYSPSLDLKSNFSAWQNSLSEKNMTLIDMESGSLIPLYELIPDDKEYYDKKKELKKSIEDYLDANRFRMADPPKPLYRYYSPALEDHFYTLNWNELGYGNGVYSFESITCNIYDIKVKGTVPLYRYYYGNSKTGDDHLYTTNWSELQNGKNGYVFEGVAGYVYPNKDHDSSLVPLYRCCRVSRVKKALKMDHFYTLNRCEFEGKPEWVDEGIVCYVYRPSSP